MKPNWTIVGIAAAGGFLSAFLVDWHAYLLAKQADSAAKYDWGLALGRWIAGALSAALLALGVAPAVSSGT